MFSSSHCHAFGIICLSLSITSRILSLFHPYPLNHPHRFSSFMAFVVLYSHYAVLHHFPSPYSPPYLFSSSALATYRWACARTDCDFPSVSLFPYCHAILPFGVERRVCCDGERGSAWFGSGRTLQYGVLFLSLTRLVQIVGIGILGRRS
jgi:hypothetical protein